MNELNRANEMQSIMNNETLKGGNMSQLVHHGSSEIRNNSVEKRHSSNSIGLTKVMSKGKDDLVPHLNELPENNKDDENERSSTKPHHRKQ